MSAKCRHLNSTRGLIMGYPRSLSDSFTPFLQHFLLGLPESSRYPILAIAWVTVSFRAFALNHLHSWIGMPSANYRAKQDLLIGTLEDEYYLVLNSIAGRRIESELSLIFRNYHTGCNVTHLRLTNALRQ
jgi:hypothetical protein